MSKLGWAVWIVLSAAWIGFWLWFLGRAGISVRADTLYLWIVFGTPFGVLAATVVVAALIARSRGFR